MSQSHDYHQGLEKYDEQAIFQTGCGECEHRAADLETVMAFTDRDRLARLWARGPHGQHSELDMRVWMKLARLADMVDQARRAGVDLYLIPGGKEE